MRLWPNRYATPAYSLRFRLGRCEVGSWWCWRRGVLGWPLVACERHLDSPIIDAALAVGAALADEGGGVAPDAARPKDPV